ncbi:NifB/NifX family molybdenum-iron cluster-binding protein [Azospirillum sp. TSO22-1]|uniref:NifB/NifX family molybdenum-iron cluster-binding protein n=1 Tax=Azospirillum sp. TSO22-1 TaxID=716789 RepID=UPI000D618C87|nr:NifB/NifX family molybdenum-iron cluster-binding protein [Azospirillum sp. TSO22-1]PWC42402.1 nitrogen fixation protein [Azospirillum sp. TSO22-1]
MSDIGHIKIALTTNSLTDVDADFASARQMVFYDVSYDSAEFLDAVQFGPGKAAGGKGPGGGAGCSGPGTEEAGDLTDQKIGALAGCAVLFTRRLSDFAAVRVRDAKVFPVKMETPREVGAVIEQLQAMMNRNPPLWLRKALGYGVRNNAFLVEKEA